jgi:peptidyl-prolyl cis-trans isomerase B (cyclophilin B)
MIMTSLLIAATAMTPFQPMEDLQKNQVIGANSSLGDAKPLDGEEVAVIDTNHGRIILRMYRDKAPGHVDNFVKLAKEKFYDKTIFHRVIPGFMIQGGDPNTKDPDKTMMYGTGGPGHKVKAEFNDVTHARGILSMARSSDPDSAGSQFFICVKDSDFLDRKYTVFGRVVKDGTEKEGEEPAGLKVADKIVNLARNDRDLPNERAEMTVTIQTWPLK